MTSTLSNPKLLSYILFFSLQISLLTFILGSFVLTQTPHILDEFKFKIILFLRILASLTLSANSFFLLWTQNAKKMTSILQASGILMQITPFLDVSFFLNLEYESYSPTLCLYWIGMFKLSFFFGLSLILYHSFHQKFMIFLTSLLVLINTGALILRFLEWSILIHCSIELCAFCCLFQVYYSFFSQKPINERGNECLSRVLNIIKEGVLVLNEKDDSNLYEIEYYNAKFLQLLKTLKTPVFEELDQSFLGFYFQKIKFCHHPEEKSSISIQIGNMETDSKKGPFNSLSELLIFYKNFTKNCSENLLINFVQKEKKSNNFRLKLSLKREIIQNHALYIFSLQTIEKLLTLQEKSESKNRLLNAFTHEIKTPLNGSIPALEEVRDHLNNSNMVYVDRAMASLKLLENSLNNIIDYSLAVSEQFIVHLSKVDLEVLLEEIFLTVKAQVELKNLELTIDIDRDLLKNPILTDYNRLKQLILNILLNAVQFTLKGSIRIDVSIDGGDNVRVVIEDSGLGMGEEKLEIIRMKLKEGENNESQVNSTGYCLGLIVSQRIALLLGKNGLEIKSSPNEGTKVQFSIIDQSRDPCDSIDKERFLNRQTKRILENSKILHSIRTKNANTQKTLKTFLEQSISCILSEEQDKPNVSGSENEANLDKILPRYDQPKLKIFAPSENRSKFSSHDLSQIPSPTKAIYSLHQISSPLLRECRKKMTTLKVVQEEETIEDKTETCVCEEILIVDDDAFNLLSLEMILKSFHFKCVKALNGYDALSLIAERRKCGAHNCKGGFQLIFMDYQMPDLDGVETTKRIIQRMEEKKIAVVPIIGCTAFTAKDEVENCLNAGMKDVIFKPLSKSVIGNILKEWI